MDTWFKAEKRDNGEGHIAIFSDIGAWGVSASDFRRQLDAIGKVDTLNVAIGSNGGDVFTGFQIYNMLARHDARKIVTIEGIAASMASVIAMAGDEVVIPENSMIMIHDPTGGVSGSAEEIQSFAEAMKKMRQNIIDAYRSRTGLSSKEVRAMMEKTTWLDAKEAKQLGFADTIEKPMAIVNAVDLSRFPNVPAAFGRASTTEDAMTTAAKDGEPKVKTEKEIRADLLAHGKEVRSMCVLAGFPALADKLIEDDADLPAVITALNAAKAKKDEDDSKGGKSRATGARDEIRTHAPADGGGETADGLDPTTVFAKWNAAGARR
jgi:ATP-dependent Clp protease protease subunit